MVAMEVDGNGFEVLGRQVCLDLLRTVPVGRIGLSVNALPVVVPVGFHLDGDRLVVRTTGGSRLDAALTGAVVAFEADHIDAGTGDAWSVLVRGSSAVLRPPFEAPGPPLDDRWALGPLDHWVMITTDLVSGRRTRRRPAGAPAGA